MNNKGKIFKTIEQDFEKNYPISLKNRHMETTIFRLRSGHNLLNSPLTEFYSLWYISGRQHFYLLLFIVYI